MDMLRTPSDADYDRAWDFIMRDGTLQLARSRLSAGALRKIIKHCANAFTGAGVVDAIAKTEAAPFDRSKFETSLRDLVNGKDL